MAVAISERTLEPLERLCTRNVSRALIERPYSCAPQAVGAVYDRPGFFVQSPLCGYSFLPVPKQFAYNRNVGYKNRRKYPRTSLGGRHENHFYTRCACDVVDRGVC